MNIKKIVIGGIITIGLIQFIPYGKNHTNPKSQGEPNWSDTHTKQLFMRACGDCHSHNTKWPWYSNIAPISWLVQHDVDEGREHFNVSLWGVQKKNKGKDAYEELEENEMPPFIYIINHPEAKLLKEDKIQLINGLKQTFK